MKTNTNRIRLNRNAARPSPQVKTSRRKPAAEFQRTNPDAHPSCLVIFDRVEQMPVAKIPLTDAEFYAVLEHNLGGPRAEQFIADAIREKLRGLRGMATLDELRFATRQAQALLTVMTESESLQMAADAFSPDAKQGFKWGMSDLLSQTCERLQSAMDATCNAINGKSEVAS